MTKQYYVYILAKARNSTFYVGVTNDLIRRIYEHKHGLADGFTKKYGIKMLVYYEICDDVNAAIWREKLIKKWRREIIMEAIERMNPDWKDLYDDLVGDVMPSHDGIRHHKTRPRHEDGVTSKIKTGDLL